MNRYIVALMSLLLLFCCIVNAHSFDNLDNYDKESAQAEIINTYSHNLGFGAGITTGLGLSYRFFPNSGKFGMQFNLGPRYEFDSNYSGWLSTGLSFLYHVNQTGRVNLLLYQSNHLLTTYFKSSSNSYDMFVGTGFCIEIVIRERLSYNIMGGVGGMRNFETFSITGEMALFYKF